MIIFINGSVNSGKSTVSKILAEKIGNTAVLEIDDLRHFISWMPLDDALPINWENAFSVMRNFLKHKINVVIPYPISKRNYDLIIENIKDINDKVYFFTLNPALDSVLQNRGAREITEKERDRIKYHYEIGINNPAFGEILDNTNELPNETASRIFSRLN